MRTERLKYALALSCTLFAVTANAAAASDEAKLARKPAADSERIIYFPARGVEKRLIAKASPTNHGGPVITSARVVFIFWGPFFSNPIFADYTYATGLQTFRNQFGTTGEYNTITQYCGSNGCVAQSSLGSGSADFFDPSFPPANITDADVRSEVNKYLATHTKDDNAIYEVVLPSTSYSTDNSGGTSCGGPNLKYCAYHSWIGSGTTATKYSIQPYPSCVGCQTSGWSAVQNQEHFVTHETREAVTDPTGSTWFDSSGQELDDKCAWSPPPFLSLLILGYGYQYEWSNANGGCVQTR